MPTIAELYEDAQWYKIQNAEKTVKQIDHANINYWDANAYITNYNRKQNILSSPINIVADYVEKMKLREKNFNYYQPEEKKFYNPVDEIIQEKNIMDKVDEEFLSYEFINQD